MIGENIKLLRKKNNLSQKELGEMLNVSQQAVGKWETGKSEPDNSIIVKLAKIFNVQTDFILNGIEEQSHSNTAPRLQLLARHLDELPDEQRERIIKNFEDTIEDYLKIMKIK